MAYLNINIPPVECWVRSNFLQNRPDWGEGDTYLPCVIFGMSSIPHRVPLFHFLMEDEGIWWRMPPHAFCSKPGAPQVGLHELVLWDSFSYYASCTQFDLMIGKRMGYRDRSAEWQWGTYMMTIDWAAEDKNVPDLGFSEAPGQHKCGHMIRLDSGNFAIQPNNRCRMFDPSFTTKPYGTTIRRQLNSSYWTVEDTNRWSLSDDERYDYDITPQ